MMETLVNHYDELIQTLRRRSRVREGFLNIGTVSEHSRKDQAIEQRIEARIARGKGQKAGQEETAAQLERIVNGTGHSP
jgi:hypothetical protein